MRSIQWWRLAETEEDSIAARCIARNVSTLPPAQGGSSTSSTLLLQRFVKGGQSRPVDYICSLTARLTCQTVTSDRQSPVCLSGLELAEYTHIERLAEVEVASALLCASMRVRCQPQCISPKPLCTLRPEPPVNRGRTHQISTHYCAYTLVRTHSGGCPAPACAGSAEMSRPVGRTPAPAPSHRRRCC